MLVLEGVSKIYPNGVRALEGVSLTVDLGEIVAIVGGSGCGKSTMLRAIAGLDAPTRGRIALDGATISAPHEKIGIVFQEPRLLPWLTVAQNVAFGIGHLPAAERAARVDTALDRVGLADKAHVWPRELSGGQAQRVAIARALVPRPEVLLLDEPFSALDAFLAPTFRASAGAVGRFAPDARARHHDVDEAIALADRILVMKPRPGRILTRSTTCPGRATGAPRSSTRRGDGVWIRSTARWAQIGSVRERMLEATYSI